MKKSLLSIASIAMIGFAGTAQIVNIPDANFKAYLVADNGINTNMDAEIQVSEANAFTGSIICSSLGITDLTGIESFTSLTELNVYNNNLTTLDVSQNTNLTSLVCAVNNLSVLDVTANTSLSILNCEENNLISLDLSQNILLSQLFCSFNNITALDVTQNVNLQNFHIYNNDISSIDVSQNTSLLYFYCQSNNLTFLDMSNNTSMTYFTCGSNSLTYLNMKNLSTVTLANFNSLNSPNLTCIEVDDVAASTSAWTNIDPASSFSLDCITLVNSITVSGQGGATSITTNGGTLQMMANVLPTYADDDTYTWSVTNGTGSATIDASGLLTPMTNGTVTVIATANDASGITGSTDITISNQTSAGINDQAALSNLSIYPNPAKTSFTIEAEEEVKSIVFINLMGEIVKTSIAPTNTVDLSDLATGIYMLQIQFDNAVVNQRLIKE